MRRQNNARLCEWADLVGADLPEEIACEHDDGSRSREEQLQTER